MDLRAHNRYRRRSHRLLDLSEGAPAPVATLGGEALPRHSLLERTRPRRSLRRLRTAQAIRRRGSFVLSAGAMRATAQTASGAAFCRTVSRFTKNCRLGLVTN